MRGWIFLSICLVPLLLFYVSGKTGWMVVSIVNAVANFWSFGIMHNYATDPDAAPDWATVMNFVSFILGIGLIVYAFIAG